MIEWSVYVELPGTGRYDESTADELLEARLQAGWKPTPSRLREGERVLGYAACVFDRAEPDAKRTSGPQAGA